MKPPPPAQRIEQVQNPMIPTVAAWTAEYPGTISLGQGVVHYGPPPSVREAIVAAVRDGGNLNRYGPVRGQEALLRGFEEKLLAENGIGLEGRSVICTAGSNMGFLNALLAVTDVGDEIVLLSPYYFNQHMAVELAGCRVVEVSTDENYQPIVAAIRGALTPRTRAVVTISPNNPTGAMYSQEALTAINRLCGQHGCYHISDEAYEYFAFGETQHFSPASLADSTGHTISLFSLSKAYGMAGWRCAAMVVPAAIELSVKKVQDTNLICPPTICQVAALAALQAGRGWCHKHIEPLRAIRQRVLEELGNFDARVEIPTSEGAFYFLLRLATEMDDVELVHRLIREFGVAVLPGSTFGMTSTALRLSFGSLQADSVDEALNRLKRGLAALL